jgi:hypothetical protein
MKGGEEPNRRTGAWFEHYLQTDSAELVEGVVIQPCNGYRVEHPSEVSVMVKNKGGNFRKVDQGKHWTLKAADDEQEHLPVRFSEPVEVGVGGCVRICIHRYYGTRSDGFGMRSGLLLQENEEGGTVLAGAADTRGAGASLTDRGVSSPIDGDVQFIRSKHVWTPQGGDVTLLDMELIRGVPVGASAVASGGGLTTPAPAPAVNHFAAGGGGLAEALSHVISKPTT